MNPAWTLDQWHETLPIILTDLYRLTADLGGLISGEHGIGSKRKGYMPLCVSPAALDMMRAVKTALDPNHVLNPGKVLEGSGAGLDLTNGRVDLDHSKTARTGA
jgi:glycolate oxidase